MAGVYRRGDLYPLEGHHVRPSPPPSWGGGVCCLGRSKFSEQSLMLLGGPRNNETRATPVHWPWLAFIAAVIFIPLKVITCGPRHPLHGEGGFVASDGRNGFAARPSWVGSTVSTVQVQAPLASWWERCTRG